MKLLFVLSEYLPESGGGIISYYADILPHLLSNGHSVDVLVASMHSLDRPEVLVNGVRVTYIKSDFLIKAAYGFERFRIGYPTFTAFLPLAWAAYEQVGHGSGYDLVETTDFPLLFVPWLISKDSPPVVVSLHGSCGQLDWYELPKRNSNDGDLLRLVERVAFACAPTVYTNSLVNARFWEGATKRKVDILLPRQPQIPDLDIHGGERSSEGVVVGRFQNWKGSRVLARAIRGLPDEKVRWIGKDVVDPFTHRPHSDLIDSEFPKIIGTQLILTGMKSREHVLKEIGSAHYLCIPSEWDVFNLTAVEAMTLGTPVICSIEAGASMLIEHGRNGFLFNPEKPEELINCIRAVRALCHEDRQAIISNAKKSISLRMDDGSVERRISYYNKTFSEHHEHRVDAWLFAMLSPRADTGIRRKLLRSFTVKELAVAAVLQVYKGLVKRLKKLIVLDLTKS